MRVLTALPPLRPGRNFHLLTAWTASSLEFASGRTDHIRTYDIAVRVYDETHGDFTGDALAAHFERITGLAWNLATGTWSRFFKSKMLPRPLPTPLPTC